MDAFATRARASKATMYRKWPGKAELVADALRRQAESQSAELPDTGSVRGDLLWITASIAATFASTDGGPSLVSLVEAIRADTVLRDVVAAQIRERSRRDGALVCARASARGQGGWLALIYEVAAVLVAGLYATTRRAYLAELRDRAQRLEREHDQTSALAAVTRSPAQASEAIRGVSTTAREALAKTRRLLGILRAEDGLELRQPLPGLAELEGLFTRVRSAGLHRGDSRPRPGRGARLRIRADNPGNASSRGTRPAARELTDSAASVRGRGAWPGPVRRRDG